MAEDKLSTAPVLISANKQDLVGCATVEELEETLDLNTHLKNRTCLDEDLLVPCNA